MSISTDGGILRKLISLLLTTSLLAGCGGAQVEEPEVGKSSDAYEVGAMPELLGLTLFEAEEIGRQVELELLLPLGFYPSNSDWDTRAKRLFICHQEMYEDRISVKYSSSCEGFWAAPDVGQMSLPLAVREIETRGLKYEVTYIGEASEDSGIVCEQEPKAETYIPKGKVFLGVGTDCTSYFTAKLEALEAEEQAAKQASEEELKAQAEAEEEAARQAQIDDPNTPLGTRAFINGSLDGLGDLQDQVQYIKDTALVGDLCLFICWLNISLAKNLVEREIAPDSYSSEWESLKQQLEDDVEAMNTARDYFWDDILSTDELVAEIDRVLKTVRKMQTLVQGIPYPEL